MKADVLQTYTGHETDCLSLVSLGEDEFAGSNIVGNQRVVVQSHAFDEVSPGSDVVAALLEMVLVDHMPERVEDDVHCQIICIGKGFQTFRRVGDISRAGTHLLSNSLLHVR
jgi:hypothetical protein